MIYSGGTVMHKCCLNLLQSHLADPEHESFGVVVPECQSNFDISFPLIETLNHRRGSHNASLSAARGTSLVDHPLLTTA